MKTCIIVNPGARLVDNETIHAVESLVDRFGDTVVRTTARPGEATHFAREALLDGFERIVAAGGDGTVNEVLNGMAHDFRRSTLGILPLGTGNDLVRSLGIPADLEGALDVLQEGRVRSLDVVRVSNSRTRYFINMSAGGFSGDVDENLTEEMKASWGPLAYLRSGFEVLPALTAYRTSFVFDDEEALEIEAYNVLLANARYIGGGIPAAPLALLDDGLLDVIVVPATGIARMMILLPQILLGQHMDSKLIIHRRASRVSVRSEPEMALNMDGELIGKEPTTFEVLPGAIDVVIGPAPEAFSEEETANAA